MELRRIQTAVTVTAAAISLAAPLPALSQQHDKNAVGSRVLRCASINDERIRLSCFDDVANAVALERRASEVTPAAVAMKQPCAGDESDCGAEPAMQEAVAVGAAAASAYADEADEQDAYSDKQVLSVSIVKTREDAVGRWLFYLDNGQIWRQLEKTYVTIPKDLPAEATISSGFLNSNNLRVGEDGRTIKVKRLK